MRRPVRIPRAKGRRHVPGRMNKTEAAYAERLTADQTAGDVLWWAFEAVKLRLADRTFYTPDFLVMQSDLSVEFHEVKGHWEDDARVKIKVAAEMYPLFRFLAFSRTKAGWKLETFS